MATGREGFGIGVRGFLPLAASPCLLIVSSLCTFHPFWATTIQAEIWPITAALSLEVYMVLCFVPCSQCEMSYCVLKSEDNIFKVYKWISYNDGRRGSYFLNRMPSLRAMSKLGLSSLSCLPKYRPLLKKEKFSILFSPI